MFGLCSRRRKQRSQEDVAVEKKQPSCPTSVTDTPPVSAEAGKDKQRKRTKWIHCLPSLFKKKKNEEKTSDGRATPPSKTSLETPWWCLPFRCCTRRRNRVTAAPQKETRQSPQPERRSPKKVNETNERGQSSSFSHQDEVMPFEALDDCDPVMGESVQLHGFQLPNVPSYDDVREQAVLMALVREQFSSTPTRPVSFSDGVKGSTHATGSLGFPNVGMSCYVNSSLQSLLTLENFMRDIICQEPVWSSIPEAQLMRGLMDIRNAHTSTDVPTKRRLLRLFKEAVSAQAPEFRDRQQKDAHEFFSTVLAQMRSLSPLLQDIAATMGRRYTCPVEEHLVFRMENTRTCKRCGARSTRQEEFTNLSLDLVPGAPIEKMLQEYTKETELEFRCECGGQTSGQSSTFATLPRVLVLHLKRFRYTPSYRLEKVHDPVELQRDLVVSSKEHGACYSLVSIISHFGHTEGGHYISDGVHPDDRPDEPTDRWLTFNDSAVSETTGSSVCEERQDLAYVLFYKRLV